MQFSKKMGMYRTVSVVLGTAVTLTGCYSLPTSQGAEARGKVGYAVCNAEDETYELFLLDVTMQLKEAGSGWAKRYPETQELSTLEVLHRSGGERLCDRIEEVPKGAEVLVKGVYNHNREYFISRGTLQLSPEEKVIWPPGDLVPTVE